MGRLVIELCTFTQKFFGIHFEFSKSSLVGSTESAAI
jgi:hypothetical protein